MSRGFKSLALRQERPEIIDFRSFSCRRMSEGFERRLLAACQWHAATAVAFPQKSKSPLSAMHTSKPFIPISFSSNRRRLSPLASTMLQPPWLFRRKANPRSPPCTPQTPSFPFQFQAIAGGSHHLPAPCCNRRCVSQFYPFRVICFLHLPERTRRKITGHFPIWSIFRQKNTTTGER